MNKKEKIVLAAQERCTGCGACANICPKKAIQMVPDEEGFIQPQIDDDLCIQCGLCTKSCPVIHPKYVNRVVDSCYAMWAQDDIRAITSTAGFFFLPVVPVFSVSAFTSAKIAVSRSLAA